MYRWYERFQRGIFILEDYPRLDRPPDAETSENVAAVKNIISADRRITYQQIQQILNVNAQIVYLILTNYIRVRRICTLWEPYSFTTEQKQKRVRWCKKCSYYSSLTNLRT